MPVSVKSFKCKGEKQSISSMYLLQHLIVGVSFKNNVHIESLPHFEVPISSVLMNLLFFKKCSFSGIALEMLSVGF